MSRTSTDLVPTLLTASRDEGTPAVLPPIGSKEVVELFLKGRCERTLEAYRRNLRKFAEWRDTSIELALRDLLTGGHGQANFVALSWRQKLIEDGYAPKTICQCLSALRSVVKLARTLDVINWALDVDDPSSERVRDMRGPTPATLDALMTSLADEFRRSGSARAVRDLAIVHLLHDRALRRGEVVRLDQKDYDSKEGTVAVLAKGRRHERQVLTVPDETRAAVDAWVAIRGDRPCAAPEALFVAVTASGRLGGRLSGRSLARTLGKVADRAGLGLVRPHGLRHTAITSALDLAKGDVRTVQRFSRHKNVATLMLYDDERRDVGGEIAKLVARRARTTS